MENGGFRLLNINYSSIILITAIKLANNLINLISNEFQMG